MMLYPFTKDVNAEQLASEIRKSAIVTALDYISTVGTAVSVYMKDTLSPGDETILNGVVAAHVKNPYFSSPPVDDDGAMYVRRKQTKAGWNYQVHVLEITTASGVKNDKIDPVTLVKSSLGFCTFKMYDVNREETVVPALAVTTVVDWMVNYDMEIIGAILAQGSAPASDLYLHIYGAPGIANIPFTTGGLNLKHYSNGAMPEADSGATKFLSATLPVAGANKFRIICDHGLGVQHSFSLAFRIFKA